MSESRYDKSFAALRHRGEGAFVPFTVLGDPDPVTSLAVLEALVDGGADMLELGIAFSDPVADGPVIQGADKRALDAGVTPTIALDILKRFRRGHPEIPIGLLLYANLIHRPGPAAFYADLAAAGVDSVLVADLPLEEAEPFRAAAAVAGVESVFMATPTTGDERLGRVLALGGPYLYTVTRAGVTGQDSSLAATAGPLVRRIRRRSEIPILLGFGISRPEHVAAAVSAGAAGAISGSAVVEIIGRHAGQGKLSRTGREALAGELCEFVAAMKKATNLKAARRATRTAERKA